MPNESVVGGASVAGIEEGSPRLVCGVGYVRSMRVGLCRDHIKSLF